MTDKPVLYVCNVDEASAVSGNAYVEAVREAIRDENAELLIVAAATEADIAELESFEEREAFLADVGLKESGGQQAYQSGLPTARPADLFHHGAGRIAGMDLYQRNESTSGSWNYPY